MLLLCVSAVSVAVFLCCLPLVYVSDHDCLSVCFFFRLPLLYASFFMQTEREPGLHCDFTLFLVVIFNPIFGVFNYLTKHVAKIIFFDLKYNSKPKTMLYKTEKILYKILINFIFHIYRQKNTVQVI